MTTRPLLLSAFLLAAGASALWATPRELSWADLSPPSTALENPFESLTPDQLDTLRAIVRIESVGGDMEKAQALRAEMAAQGLDVDALFAARTAIIENRSRAASAVSTDLLGEDVRMPGYLLPLEFRDGKAVEFLLVPTVGACIHTPPPPANQMIHVRYPEGIEVAGLYTAVWIEGTLAMETSVQTVRYSDGQSNVAVSYTMQPDAVTLY